LADRPATTSQPVIAAPVAGAVDVNVHLSAWPFRKLSLDDLPRLVDKLVSLGVTSAWCGSFDALLHRDVAAVNARLSSECGLPVARRMLVPFGTVNPMLPGWEEDLRLCHESHQMPGVRLYPNYHGYKLDAPAFARLLDLATQRALLVQIAVSMEDERVQHPLVRVAPVDVAPLPELLKTVPKARIMLLNALRGPRGGPLSALGKSEQVSFEIATLETVGGVATVLEQIPAERLVYGSHAPFFYPEAAALKMKESALSDDVARNVLSKNANRLLKGA
jgi:uncharacterized protein